MHWQRIDAVLDTPGRDAALLLIDLDAFKQINDTHGHATGDSILIHTARRLLAACSDRDLVVRLGGDEFAILLEGADRAQPQAAALRTALSEPYSLTGSLQLTCRATIGLAHAATAADRVDLLRKADFDMYDGKPRRIPQLPLRESAGHTTSTPSARPSTIPHRTGRATMAQSAPSR